MAQKKIESLQDLQNLGNNYTWYDRECLLKYERGKLNVTHGEIIAHLRVMGFMEQETFNLTFIGKMTLLAIKNRDKQKGMPSNEQAKSARKRHSSLRHQIANSRKNQVGSERTEPNSEVSGTEPSIS